MSLTFKKWQLECLHDKSKRCEIQRFQRCIPSLGDEACLVCFKQAAEQSVTDTLLKGDFK